MDRKTYYKDWKEQVDRDIIELDKKLKKLKCEFDNLCWKDEIYLGDSKLKEYFKDDIEKDNNRADEIVKESKQIDNEKQIKSRLSTRIEFNISK